MLSSPRRPIFIWQQRSGGSPSSRPIGGRGNSRGCGSGRRSTRNKVYAIVASLVLIFCAFNIIRLHNRITTDRSPQWSEINNEGDYVAVGKIEGTNVPTPSISAPEPTIANATSFWPTTHTLSPTSFHNQTSWLPTLSTEEDEHILNFGQNFLDERYNSHPRVVCFFQDGVSSNSTERNNKGTSCNSIAGIRFNLYIKKNESERLSSIPLEAKEYKGGDKEEEEEEGYDKVNEYIETDTCKYPNDKATAIAPPTCNEIHSLGFDVNMFQTNYKHPSHQRMSSIKYVTMGGAKCVWKVDTNEESFIFKSHKQSRFVKRHFYNQNQIDALISGGRGNAQLSRIFSEGSSSVNDIGTPDSDWNHILPMYHYCGLANIVPFADGNLEEWIHDNRHSGERLDPTDTLRLALQAARGLYQAHMYWNGRPSYVHADLNPSQFLVFIPKSDGSNNDTVLPILQINDFNQGRFLTRSITTNETCPFRSCSKNLRGNRYHTPERFQGCVDQNEGIDSFSLGGVFFNLLTNGFDPYYDHRNYYTPIKKGELPHIPRRLDLDHPAYDALIDVMYRCMASELNDRPSSLEVVHMLAEKLHQIGI